MNKPATGFTLIEVLVALMILAVGLLGLAALQMRANQAEMESYQRSQAMLIASDMANRIRANSSVPQCYFISADAADGTFTDTRFVGAGNAQVYNCLGWGIIETRAIADDDIAEWEDQLLGTGETLDGNSVGAMLGARGCLSYDNPSRTATVTVVWQGLTRSTDLDTDGDGIPDCRDTADTDRIDCSCANASYLDADGNDFKRWLSIPVQLADLD